MSKRRIFKKITKIALVLLLLLFFSLIGLYFAIQSPRFQTFLAQKITGVLSKSIGAEVEIGSVNIEFFNKVHLEKFMVKDQKNDTLFYFGSATANLSYFSLFDKNIDLKNITINELYVNIYRPQNDTAFNFSFLNPSKTNNPKDSTAVNEWALNLSTLSLLNSRVNFKDYHAGLVLETKLPKLITNVNEFDLQSKTFKIKEILLTEPDVKMTTLKNYKENSNKPFVLDIPVFLSSENINVENGHFNFINTLDTNNYKFLAYNKLDINKINLNFDNTYLHKNSLSLNINKLNLEEKSGLRIDSLFSQIVLNNTRLEAKNLSLKTNNSAVNANALLNFKSFESFKDFANEVRFDANLINTVINPKDLQFFTDFEKLGIKGVFRIDGEIKGKLSSLRANDVVLKAGRLTEFRGDFSLNGLPNIKETFISLRTEKLVTNYADVKYIYSKLILPPNTRKLGTINFKGKFDGFYSDFVAFGEVNTSLGYVNTDINLKMSPDGVPSYSGKINAKNFKIGEWFDLQDQIGAVSLTANVNGTGVKLESLDATITGKIQSITVKGYTYTNMDIDGSLKNKFFEGHAKIDDENLKMSFDGLVDATQKKPVYDFTASLGTINLKALNLSKLDYVLSGNLKSNFTASTIDNILGQLDIDSFTINSQGKNYKLNHLSLKSIDKGYEKEMELTADNLKMTIAGNYQLSTLPKAIKQIFLPSETASTNYKQVLRIDAEITDNTELISLFVPKLKIPNKILISANLNTESESLLASVSIPKIKFDNLKANDFVSNVFVKNGEIDMFLSMPEIILNDSVLVKDISILAKGTKDDLGFTINASDRTEKSGLNLLGNIDYVGSLYNLKLDTNSTIFINNSFWNLAKENLISFNNKYFDADFKVFHDKSEVNFKVNKLNGENNLLVNLKDIDVDDFNEFLLNKGINLQGKLNGEVKIDNFDKEPAISGDLSFLNILVNDYLIGDFKIDSRVDLPDKKVYMSGGLYSKENHIDINGMYSFDKISTPDDFNIDINIKQFTVKSLEDFIPQFISNSSGTVNGNLKLIGSRKEPNINGFAVVNDVTTKVSYTQVSYTIANTKAIFVNNEIRLADKVVVQDGEGNVAYGSGKITHKNLKNWALDIKVETDKIMALNTTIEDNPDFYGRAYIDGGATFTGITDMPLIYIYGQSVENSFLDVPLSTGVANKEFEFYTFASKKKVVKEEDGEESKPEVVKIMGAKVKLDLDIDEDLEVKLILDQNAGDVLKVKGEGNIKIDIGQQAEFVNFFGTYNVTKGDYLFTLQNVVNKPFQIAPNSKINFNGDIYKDATIDMSATYTRKVALDDFISEYLTDTDEELKNLAKNRVPVTLFLELSDRLSQPTIKFDIGIDRVDPKIRGYTETKLQSLKLNDAEMNNQIFGVLVLSRFIPSYTSLENSLSTSTGDAVLNTVTELVSSQLSRYLTDWSSTIVKDLEFFVNFSSYDNTNFSEETLEKRRELQLALSKRFFNDRLIINVGGNVDFGDSNSGGTTGNTSGSTFFGGNVSFEYSITKNRRWRMKAFTISDYDSYNTENNRTTRSGVGISYKREFDDFFDLFNLKRKVKNADTENK